MSYEYQSNSKGNGFSLQSFLFEWLIVTLGVTAGGIIGFNILPPWSFKPGDCGLPALLSVIMIMGGAFLGGFSGIIAISLRSRSLLRRTQNHHKNTY